MLMNLIPDHATIIDISWIEDRSNWLTDMANGEIVQFCYYTQNFGDKVSRETKGKPKIIRIFTFLVLEE